ncbi:MAG: hypothetical protein P4L84_00830 [Isosphaeraceae bacterium]|nr:hypothetical protein [Isosphaeraceae bacterium]
MAVPEAEERTSIKQRVEHVVTQGRVEDLKAAPRGSMAGAARSAGLEESPWLCPIEDRSTVDSARKGMLEGFTLGSYLLLVEQTGRLFRDVEASISRELAALFIRLGGDAESWQSRLLKLSEGRLSGRFFAASRQRLRDVAKHLGVHHLTNLACCAARRIGAGLRSPAKTSTACPPALPEREPFVHGARRPPTFSAARHRLGNCASGSSLVPATDNENGHPIGSALPAARRLSLSRCFTRRCPSLARMRVTSSEKRPTYQDPLLYEISHPLSRRLPFFASFAGFCSKGSGLNDIL